MMIRALSIAKMRIEVRIQRQAVTFDVRSTSRCGMISWPSPDVIFCNQPAVSIIASR